MSRKPEHNPPSYVVLTIGRWGANGKEPPFAWMTALCVSSVVFNRLIVENLTTGPSVGPTGKTYSAAAFFVTVETRRCRNCALFLRLFA